jgi:hypothetical protein
LSGGVSSFNLSGTDYTWDCNGISGGSTVSCSATQLRDYNWREIAP